MLNTLCLLSLLLTLNAFQFNQNGEFTILQVTDLHLGESDEKDYNATKLWDMLVSTAQPDLVVVSGDAVSGYAGHYSNGTVIDGFFKKCWTNFTSYFEEKGLFYAYILGNHDDEADLNRSQIIDLDKTSPFSILGLSQDTQLNDTNNYWIPIYSSKNSTVVAAIIWMFDTHVWGCNGTTPSWGCIEVDQLAWYDAESQKIKQQYGTNIQHIAYIHIPIPEFLALYNNLDFYSIKEDNIGCPMVNTGFLSHILNNGDISAVFCGHDHMNDYGGYYNGIELVYGRKSGYGSYGTLFGGRVVKLKEVTRSDGTTVVSRNHYVIQDDGSIEQNSPLRPRQNVTQPVCACTMYKDLEEKYLYDEKKTVLKELFEFGWEDI